MIGEKEFAYALGSTAVAGEGVVGAALPAGVVGAPVVGTPVVTVCVVGDRVPPAVGTIRGPIVLFLQLDTKLVRGFCPSQTA